MIKPADDRVWRTHLCQNLGDVAYRVTGLKVGATIANRVDGVEAIAELDSIIAHLTAAREDLARDFFVFVLRKAADRLDQEAAEGTGHG